MSILIGDVNIDWRCQYLLAMICLSFDLCFRKNDKDNKIIIIIINVATQQTQSDKTKILETQKINNNKKFNDNNKIHILLRDPSFRSFLLFFIRSCLICLFQNSVS